MAVERRGQRPEGEQREPLVRCTAKLRAHWVSRRLAPTARELANQPSEPITRPASEPSDWWLGFSLSRREGDDVFATPAHFSVRRRDVATVQVDEILAKRRRFVWW